MPRKEKEIVWHKKKAKFLPASIEKAGGPAHQEVTSSSAASRRQQFAQDLLKKIRIAVRNPSKNKSAS